MVVDRLANTDEMLELRSAALTLVSVLPKTTDLAALARDLEARSAENPGLFDHDAVVVDLSEVHDEPLDIAALAELLRGHRMMPVAVKGGSPGQIEAARAAGLADAPESMPLAKAHRAPAHDIEAPRVMPDAASAAAGPLAAGFEAGDAPGIPSEVGVESATRPDALLRTAVAAVGTLTIDRPLRSGQQIYARGGDLVVLAAVSVGAEVLADGHIHVYAPLRGRALAGARGNTEARIFTTCLEPQLISIAGIYRTTDVPLADDVLGKPAQVRLDGEKLVIEPLA